MRTGRNLWCHLGQALFGAFAMICIWGGIATAAEQLPLRALTAGEPPANFLKDGKLTGTSVGIVRELLKRISPETNIEFLPWARAYTIAKTTPNVLIFTAGRTQERMDLGFKFIGPVITRTHALWKLSNTPHSPNSFDQIREKGWRVSGLREDWRTKFLLEHGIIVDQNSKIQLGLKQLLHGRVDFWISSDLEAPTIARQSGITMNKITMSQVIRTSPSFLMISKGTDLALFQALEANFKQMQQEGFFDQEATNWSRILGLRLQYRPEMGYFYAP